MTARRCTDVDCGWRAAGCARLGSEVLRHRPASRGGQSRVVCGRGRDPTVSVSRCPTGSAPGQRYSPDQVDVLPAERRRAARDSPAGADLPDDDVVVLSVGHETWARSSPGPRRGHPPVEVGDQVSGPVRHGGFRPPATAPARAAAASRRRPLVQSEPAIGEPVVRTGRSRRREPTAAPFGCRRSGATAPARRRRRGTRPAGGTTPQSPRGGDQGQLREQGQKVPRILKPEDRDAGRAKRRISPPPANNPVPAVDDFTPDARGAVGAWA